MCVCILLLYVFVELAEKYHRLSYNLFLTPHLYIYSVLKITLYR